MESPAGVKQLVNRFCTLLNTTYRVPLASSSWLAKAAVVSRSSGQVMLPPACEAMYISSTASLSASSSLLPEQPVRQNAAMASARPKASRDFIRFIIVSSVSRAQAQRAARKSGFDAVFPRPQPVEPGSSRWVDTFLL